MANTNLTNKLKPEFRTSPPAEENGILMCLDDAQVQGDNAKYMKFYNRMATVYDLGERWLGAVRLNRHRYRPTLPARRY